MIYTVDMTLKSSVNFAPATVEEEIAQNIRTILTTPLGSAPLARAIGLDYQVVDEPYAMAEARLIGEVIGAIAEQEPRAQVTEVSFGDNLTDALTGRLLATVKYALVEGVE